MFGFNKEKSSNNLSKKEEAGQKVHADLIVHNMPPASSLSTGPALNQPAKDSTSFLNSQKSLAAVAPKNNFKLVGVLIIAGGAIFIGLLFYLSYLFIIKPATKSSLVPENIINVPTSSVQTADNNSASLNESPAVIDATTTEIGVSTIAVVDLASSSASNTLASDLGGENDDSSEPLLDSDNDGLNDEEEAVFGSNPNLADTNNNTYSDLTEIINSYNPIGSGRLNADPNLTLFVSKTLGYSILVPTSWPVKSLNNDNTILFTAPDESLIQISLQDNTNKQSILGWYGDSFPDDSVTYDRLKNMPTWDGVMATDEFNFYLTDKKRKNIYIISYIPTTDNRVAYPNVFKVMINSLILK